MAGIGWSPKRIEHEISQSHYDDGRSKGYVGHVNPMDFLHATTRDDAYLKTIFDEAGNLNFKKLTKETQSPFLEFKDGKISGHEGRHRMAALAKNGYTKVPVMVKPYWSSGKNLTPIDQVNFEPQFEGRNPVTINNLIPLNKNYKNQIDDMMAEHPEHFQDGGPITAYHGSPHDFEQFDTSKIGTGEGAQAYGHGLYFAEHEPVAKGYAKEIAKQQHVDPSMHFDGGTIYQGQELNDLTPAQIAAHVVADNGIDTAHKLMSEWAQDYHSGPMWKSALQALQENPNKFADAKWKHGHMYEVAIDAHPDHFLDWDKPISGQSEHAKNAVSNLVADRYLHPTFRNELADLVDRGWFTGEKLHEKLTAKHGLPMAAGLLDKHGLHGIKYFDAGSRGSNEQQTRNYVVFDHNRVKVRRKYEQGGAVAKSPAKLHNPAIVEHVLTKVSAPPPALNPSPVASGDARSKPSGDTYV